MDNFSLVALHSLNLATEVCIESVTMHCFSLFDFFFHSMLHVIVKHFNEIKKWYWNNYVNYEGITFFYPSIYRKKRTGSVL